VSDDGRAENIREVLGHFIGCRLVDITQQLDKNDNAPATKEERGIICLHFDNGHTIEVDASDGLSFDVDDTPDNSKDGT
jgi:hypothetical protein